MTRKEIERRRNLKKSFLALYNCCKSISYNPVKDICLSIEKNMDKKDKEMIES